MYRKYVGNIIGLAITVTVIVIAVMVESSVGKNTANIEDENKISIEEIQIELQKTKDEMKKAKEETELAKLEIKKITKALEDEIKIAKQKMKKAQEEAKIAKLEIEKMKQNNDVEIAVPTENPRAEIDKIITAHKLSNTIQFEQRPKTYVTALQDQRLTKLPEPQNQEYNREEVIAIRHHALMLLKSNECSGIIEGGRSVSQKGWLYVICSDDPDYLRQFPLEEVTW